MVAVARKFPDEEPASGELAKFLHRPSKGGKSRTLSESAWRKAKEDASRRMASGEWEGAQCRVFLASYALLHEEIYGVEPEELTPSERYFALAIISRFLHYKFDDNPSLLAAFLRWTWVREKGRERWRRENNQPGRRIGWKAQFSGYLLTDYKLDLARGRT
jgi:hypothetical protein